MSEWQRGELQALRKFIDKAQGLTIAQLRNDPGLQLKGHKGKAASGFSRPKELSKEISLSELRVTGRARVHGALLNNVFYLVWLDRGHDVFPER